MINDNSLLAIGSLKTRDRLKDLLAQLRAAGFSETAISVAAADHEPGTDPADEPPRKGSDKLRDLSIGAASGYRRSIRRSVARDFGRFGESRNTRFRCIAGGRDRLVDAIVAWGTEDKIRDRIQAHFRAGATHVCIQPLRSDNQPLPDLRAVQAFAPGGG